MRAIFLQAYERLLEHLSGSSNSTPDWYVSYEFEHASGGFIYDMLSDDYYRELLNAYHQFMGVVNRLSVWETVVSEFDSNLRDEVRMEFTAIPLDFALGFPYRFKQRVAFCATHMSYAKGVEKGYFGKSAVRSERQIDLKAFRAISEHWPAARELVQALELIDAPRYREATNNYRNRAEHRHPPRLDFGQTVAVEIQFPEDMKVGYAFGVFEPISTIEILPYLASEGRHMRDSLFKFAALVKEQCVSSDA